MRELYSDKKLRDARAKELQSQGLAVRRRATGPARVHPEYIVDQRETPAGQDRGFGNQAYLTMWPNLYEVEVIR